MNKAVIVDGWLKGKVAIIDPHQKELKIFHKKSKRNITYRAYKLSNLKAPLLTCRNIFHLDMAQAATLIHNRI